MAGTKRGSSSTSKNTAVYVTNLPKDITTEEIVGHFSKCGIIMDEIMTGKPRVKLYCDEDGNLKGDALIVYLREESVNLALNILDESEIRPSIKINVQEASKNTENGSVAEVTEVAEINNETHSTATKKNRIDKETWKKHMKRMQK